MAVAVPSANASRERVVAWLVVAATAAALTLAFAAPYGTLNQATYLLDPLHRAMPELFRRDWLVHATPAEQPVFGWLAHWLYVLDPEGSTAMIAANAAVTFATYLALYWLITAVCRGGRGVAVFVIVASFTTVTMGRAMGGSYLLAGYLQPSSPATLGWIAAMAALVRGRYALCGAVLAVAGALHINFLVLGIGLFTLGALARRDVDRRALALLLAPQLLVLAGFLPSLLAAAGPSDEALAVLTRFHAPGHYLGSRVIVWAPALLAWQLAAFAALPLVDGAAREARALWRFSLVSCVIAVGGGLVICIPALERLTQVFWSRVAPFGQLGCHVLITAALVGRFATTRFSASSAVAYAGPSGPGRTTADGGASTEGGASIESGAPTESETSRGASEESGDSAQSGSPAEGRSLADGAPSAHAAPLRSVARRAWAGAAIAMALVLDGHFAKLPVLSTVVSIVIVAAALAVPARLARPAGAALAAIALGVALWASPRGEGLTTVPAGSDGEVALVRWARTSTPTDALFFTPPRLGRFRLLARRAIVADTKSPPLRPDALVAWYHRLCATVERSEAPTHEAIEQAWNALSPSQLERIARAFGADYIVTAPWAELSGERVYGNDEYAVYRIR